MTRQYKTRQGHARESGVVQNHRGSGRNKGHTKTGPTFWRGKSSVQNVKIYFVRCNVQRGKYMVFFQFLDIFCPVKNISTGIFPYWVF
jgi:hypothetical protein